MILKNQKRWKRRRPSLTVQLLLVFLSILFLTGFIEAEILAKRTGSKKSKKGSGSTTDPALLPVVTAFADSYASKVIQSNIILQNRLNNYTDRLTAYQMIIQSVKVAYDISIEPNSAIALLDMTVMVTLQRITWEEFWYPKRFGGPAQGHVEILRQLEKEIWAIAAKFLTPEQRRDLRNLILKWRKINPDQHIVGSIRFSHLRDELGKGLKDPKGLFSGIRKAANTAEELRMLGERYRYLLTRMQMLLNPQLQLAYLQLISQPEVDQLLKDTNRMTSSVELFAKTASELPETAKNLIKEVGAESEQFRKLVHEVQQMLTVGNEVISSANQTLDSIDSLVIRFDPIREKKQGAKPIDITEYRGAAKDFAETAREAYLMIQSLDQLLANHMKSNQVSRLSEAAGKIKQESEDLIDHIFYRATTFCLLIIVGIMLAVLIYRYVSYKLFDTNRKQKFL